MEPMGGRLRSGGGRLLLLGALIVVPVFLYAPSLDNGWSDDDMVYLEATLHHPADLPRLFMMDAHNAWAQRHYADDAYGGWSPYRPVAYVYFALLRPAFGRYAPAYRVVNLLVYTLGTLLVLRLIRRLTGHQVLAWLTAGLFAVDYVRVNYVLSVAPQGGLVLVLYVGSVLAYLTARTAPEAPRRRLAYILSLLAGGGACFDYELAISLPLALLLLEWFGGRLRHQWSFRPVWVLPHGFLVLLYIGMRTVVERGFYPVRAIEILNLANPYDLFFATINTVSRGIMLFVYDFPSLRKNLKVWIVGSGLSEMPTPDLLASQPFLLGAVVGLLLAAGWLVVWFLSRPRVRQVLWHDPRGQWALWAGGWILITLGPAATFHVLVIRHLVLAAVGAALLKAMGVVTVVAWLQGRWGGVSRWLMAGLFAPLLLYSVSPIVLTVAAQEQYDRAAQTRLTEAIRLIREAAPADQPLIVYYLNGETEHDLLVGLQELVQAALGREQIRVVAPYVVNMHQDADESVRDAPQVTITPEEIVVVNASQRPPLVRLVQYHGFAIRPGLTVRNGTLYTLEVLEADSVTHNLLRFVIRYARPPGTRVMFLMFEGGQLVRRDTS